MKNNPSPLPDVAQEAVLAELETLRRLLAATDPPTCATAGEGLVIMRLCSGLDLTQWEAMARRLDLRDWLAMPLSSNPLPFLTRIQDTLRELMFLSEHDPLTTLINRGAFERILDAELVRAARAGQTLTLVLFDCDDFKAINDSYGHPCGDRVLESIGALLAREKRVYDHAARVGGEEFALILPGLGLVRAQLVVERILAATRTLTVLCDGVDTPLHLTLSAGLVCTKGKKPVSRQTLYAQADAALYQAKSAGKDRFVTAPILDLTGPPEVSLVRADEKRFLFTGTSKG